MSVQNKDFMQQAVDLSGEKMREGHGGPFGALIVKDGKILARGFNRVTSTNDPTAHAEVVAIREACTALGTFDLAGCEIYTSCEPCPMCLSAIYWARLDRIYFSNTREEAAAIGFDDALIYEEIPKAVHQRKIPMVHVPSDKAREIFDEWQSKLDKISY